MSRIIIPPHNAEVATVGYTGGWHLAPGSDVRHPDVTGDAFLFQAALGLNPHAQKVAAVVLSFEEFVKARKGARFMETFIRDVAYVGIPCSEYLLNIAEHEESAASLRTPNATGRRTAVHASVSTHHLPSGKRINAFVWHRDRLLFDLFCADLDITHGLASPFDKGRARISTDPTMPESVRDLKASIHAAVLNELSHLPAGKPVEGVDVIAAVKRTTGLTSIELVRDPVGRVGLRVVVPDLKRPLRFLGHPYDIAYDDLRFDQSYQSRNPRAPGDEREIYFPAGVLDRSSSSHARIKSGLQVRVEARAELHHRNYGRVSVVFPSGCFLRRAPDRNWVFGRPLVGAEAGGVGDLPFGASTANADGMDDRSGSPTEHGQTNRLAAGVQIGGPPRDERADQCATTRNRPFGGSPVASFRMGESVAGLPIEQRRLVSDEILAAQNRWITRLGGSPSFGAPAPRLKQSENEENHEDKIREDYRGIAGGESAVELGSERDCGGIGQLSRALALRIRRLVHQITAGIGGLCRAIGKWHETLREHTEQSVRLLAEFDDATGRMGKVLECRPGAIERIGADVSSAITGIERFFDGACRAEIGFRPPADREPGAHDASEDTRGLGPETSDGSQFHGARIQYDEAELPGLGVGAKAAGRIKAGWIDVNFAYLPAVSPAEIAPLSRGDSLAIARAHAASQIEGIGGRPRFEL